MLNLNRPPAAAIDILDPAELDVLRKTQSDWYDLYVEWLNHPFTKLRWQEAYQRMHNIAAQRLAPGRGADPELETDYRLMKGIVDGSLDTDVYTGYIGKLTAAAVAEAIPAQRADAAVGGQTGGDRPRHPDSPARVLDNLLRGQPPA